jgi:hypothetical protein
MNKKISRKILEAIFVELIAQVFNHFIDNFFYRILILTIGALIAAVIVFAPDNPQPWMVDLNWLGNFMAALRKQPVIITIISVLHIIVGAVVGITLFPFLNAGISPGIISWLISTFFFIGIGIGLWYRKRFARIFTFALLPGYALFFFVLSETNSAYLYLVPIFLILWLWMAFTYNKYA